MRKPKDTAKVITRNKIKQIFIFSVTLPNGQQYVDSSTNKTPKEKLYYYYQQVTNGVESNFYNAIRTQCNNRTDDLQVRILDFTETNVDQIANKYIKDKKEEWIERLGTDREGYGYNN